MKKLILLFLAALLVACQKEEEVSPNTISTGSSNSAYTEDLQFELENWSGDSVPDSVLVRVRSQGPLQPWHYIGNYVNEWFFGNGEMEYMVARGDVLLTRTRHQFPSQDPLIPVCAIVEIWDDTVFVVGNDTLQLFSQLEWDTVFCASTPQIVEIYHVVE